MLACISVVLLAWVVAVPIVAKELCLPYRCASWQEGKTKVRKEGRSAEGRAKRGLQVHGWFRQDKGPRSRGGSAASLNRQKARDGAGPAFVAPSALCSNSRTAKQPNSQGDRMMI